MNNYPLLDVAECRTQLIWANERTLERRFLEMEASFSEVTVAWLLINGGLCFTSGGKQWQVKKGEWFFPAAGEGRQVFSGGTQLLSIRFQIGYPGGEGLFIRKQSLKFGVSAHPELSESGMALVQALRPWADRGSLLVGRNRIPLAENFRIEARFYDWIASYTGMMLAREEPLRLRHKGDARVAVALRYLDQQGFRRGFSEPGVAAACGLSVNQLGLLFKRETGVTPFQYFDRLRMDHAEQALSESGMQVKEIAYELGFSSSPHFTNWFKKRRGKSPRAYRKQARVRI